MQYFEYSSHEELRHNIGKQLCLQAFDQPEQVRIELCQLKGKGTEVAPQQKWVFTEVSNILICPYEIQFWVLSGTVDTDEPPFPLSVAESSICALTCELIASS